MGTIKTMFWAPPLTTLTKKANIDSAVRAKLEELGVDTVRSRLISIMNVRDLAQPEDELQPLGLGLSASRRQMQDWLTEKAVRETLWVRAGVIAARVFSFVMVRPTNQNIDQSS